MASTIKLKNGSGAPTTGDLVQGEPALDLTNKRLYTENASGVVIEVGTNPSTIDINAGTIDGTVIGGSTPAAITGTTITGTSFVSSGDMTFEDNDKAVFGNGSDLRIYHTGSHSTIENIGTGHLQIHSTDFRLRNSAGTESMILANADGNVQLYYDNAEKLATTATGIDVTGTVTADKVTIGTSSASNAKLTLEGVDGGDSAGIYFNNTTATNGKSYSLSSGNSGEFMLYDRTSSAYRLFVSSAGNISFYEDTGTTAKFFWDASEERLGIGTTSPSVDLDVEGTAQVNLLEVTHDADRAVNFVKTGANTFSIEHDVNQFYFWNQTTSESPLLFQNDGDVIINGGNVGIGTSSPSAYTGYATLALNGSSGGELDLMVGGTNKGALFSSASSIVLQSTSGSDLPLVFRTNSEERMRIDSSGHLLVGTTDASSSVAGFRAYSGGNGAFTIAGQPLELNRLSSDGSILGFQKDGATVGSIGTRASLLKIGTGDVGLLFNSSSDAILPENIDGGAGRDGAIDLGVAGAKFKDIYLSGGVRNVNGDGFNAATDGGETAIVPADTSGPLDNQGNIGLSSYRWNDAYITNGVTTGSDERDKQNIAELDDAERRVAVACKSLLRKWRWKDAVANKGDEARIHFGIIAQDLQAAFEAEGLDAGRYGMFMYNEWTDEETGEERSRMGVRYSELLAFIIAAI
jgi:hypothetical protein